MITVYHLENSQSIRILWLLEELQAEYQIQHYQRDSQSSLAPEHFKQLHLLGTSPLISDGDLLLPETNAIVDYILDCHPNNDLRPEPADPERTGYLFWLHAAQGSLMPLLTSHLVFSRLKNRVPALLKPIMRLVVGKAQALFMQPRIDRLLGLIEQTLAHNTWFAGEKFTAADIVMGYCMQVARVRIGMDQRYPNAQRFIQQMQQRPAFKRTMQKNGDFQPLAE